MRERERFDPGMMPVKEIHYIKECNFSYLFIFQYIYSQIDFSTYFSMQYPLVITKRGPDHNATWLNDNFTTCFFFISSGKSSSLSSVIICDFLIHVLGFGILHAN